MTKAKTPDPLVRREVRVQLTEEQFQDLARAAKVAGTTMASEARLRVLQFPHLRTFSEILREQGLVLQELLRHANRRP